MWEEVLAWFGITYWHRYAGLDNNTDLNVLAARYDLDGGGTIDIWEVPPGPALVHAQYQCFSCSLISILPLHLLVAFETYSCSLSCTKVVCAMQVVVGVLGPLMPFLMAGVLGPLMPSLMAVRGRRASPRCQEPRLPQTSPCLC